jgi:trans-2,3-dihydro-3-hydroxyanthranilate isomerase
MRRIRLRLDIWDRILAKSPHPHLFAFSLETENTMSRAHGRMFAPGLGVYEDAATGTAGGPVGAYLVRYGLLPNSPRSTFIMEQGIEMGRPSFIHITVERSADRVTNVRVGGQCVAVGRGDIVLDIETSSPSSAPRVPSSAGRL